MRKTYSEMLMLTTYEDRVNYLKTYSKVAEETFGYNRFVCQDFYRTREWKRTRDKVIIRDNGCDLALDGFDIHDMILVHHINPISLDDILNNDPSLYDLENLVCTTKYTHDCIHYRASLAKPILVERTRNDTAPWRK